MIVACWPGRAGLGYQADVGEFGDAFDEDDVRGLDVAMSAAQDSTLTNGRHECPITTSIIECR